MTRTRLRPGEWVYRESKEGVTRRQVTEIRGTRVTLGPIERLHGTRWQPHGGLLGGPTSTTIAALLSAGYRLPRRASA